MDSIRWAVELIDFLLITPFRWPDNPIAGWWLGTFCIALWSTLLGEFTAALAFRVNRSYVTEIAQEVLNRHNQSMNALKGGDKPAYKAINKLANEAYGKAFFMQLAMASASLWPVPFALGWMHIRFSSISFSLPFNVSYIGNSVGYPFIFIPIYIFVRIIIRKSLNRLSP